MNALAILAAAIAIYLIGFVIYGMLIPPESWMAMSGISKDQADAVGMTRMPYSPIMPVMTAIGLAVLYKWGNVVGLANGIKWAVMISFASAVPTIWYGWVYGVGGAEISMIDSAHLLVGHIVAGAILASWK